MELIANELNQLVASASPEKAQNALTIMFGPCANLVFGASKSVAHEVTALNAMKVLGHLCYKPDDYTLLKGALLPIKYANGYTYFYVLVAASLGVAVYRPFGLIAEYFQMARTRAIAIVAGGSTIGTAVMGMRWLDTPVMAAVGIGAGYLVSAGILTLALRLKLRKCTEGGGA